MHMFRHDNVTENVEYVSSAHLLQGSHKSLPGCSAGEVWGPVVTAEGEEMEVASLLVTLETGGHAGVSLAPP